MCSVDGGGLLMVPTRAGKMNRRVVLQSPNQIERFDSFGQPVADWITIGTYWAQIVPLRGLELQNARQIKARAEVKIIMRYPGVNIGPEWRAVYGSRVFGLVDVQNIEAANRRVECIAYEWQQALGVGFLAAKSRV